MSDPRDDLTTRAASYAAGALTPAERREVEDDARRSTRLAAELREFAETTALLGLAAEPVVPAADLRSRLLDAIETAPRQSAVVTRGPWLRRPVAALAGAAAAVAIALGGAAIALSVAPQPSSQVDAIVAADDAQRASAEVAGGGTVTAVWSHDLARAAILVDDLGDLPDESTYQAWLIDSDGVAAPAGTFEADPDGLRSIPLLGDLGTGDVIGITIEPAGGSPAPTTIPIVAIPTA